jgi:hypothetical protein
LSSSRLWTLGGGASIHSSHFVKREEHDTWLDTKRSLLFHPGVFHRLFFAKYAATFLKIQNMPCTAMINTTRKTKSRNCL